MLELHKRKKTWHVGGKNAAGCDIKRHTTGCTNKEAAENYRDTLKFLTVWNGRKAHLASLAPTNGAEGITITDALAEWLDTIHVESSREVYEYTVRFDQLKEVSRVSQLTAAHLQKIQNSWSSEGGQDGKGRKTSSMQTYRARFGVFLKFCVEQKYLAANLMNEVPRVKKRKPSEEDKMLGRGEEQRATLPIDLTTEPKNWNLIQELFIPFLRNELVDSHGQTRRQRTAAIHRNPEAFLALLELMYHTGLRRSDALFFRPGDIQDTPSGWGKYKTKQFKTQGALTIFLPPWLAAKLRALPRLDPDGRFCFYPRSRPDKWKNYFRNLIALPLTEFGKLVGIEGSLHAHRFRDSFAVNALNKGTKVEVVSKALGHERIATTEKYYMPFVHSREEAHEKAWAAMLGE